MGHFVYERYIYLYIHICISSVGRNLVNSLIQYERNFIDFPSRFYNFIAAANIYLQNGENEMSELTFLLGLLRIHGFLIFEQVIGKGRELCTLLI